ncbi:MAG: adenosylcobinamide-phosphate synthase CbiB [Pseudomonadota bacterium]
MSSSEVYILIAAFVADWIFGDPRGLPHLIVGYGRIISFGERQLNSGSKRFLKGTLFSIICTLIAFCAPAVLIVTLESHDLQFASFILSTLLLFYCLANRTLIEEGKRVFRVLEQKGLKAGRTQVSFIVGRDTGDLSEQQVRAATLETVSENLSDGVIAPLFYFLVLGVPGAMAYKMINTLDSMIGYRNERYEEFGRFAARLDDVANFIPARLTAVLMLLSRCSLGAIAFVANEAKKHKSPNAGYPEAALAYLLNCRFGGPTSYQGVLIEKDYIGNNSRLFISEDMVIASRINVTTSVLFVAFSVCIIFFSS